PTGVTQVLRQVRRCKPGAQRRRVLHLVGQVRSGGLFGGLVVPERSAAVPSNRGIRVLRKALKNRRHPPSLLMLLLLLVTRGVVFAQLLGEAQQTTKVLLLRAVVRDRLHVAVLALSIVVHERIQPALLT